ncbi:unnamed protein product [Porites lobata]|uniref:Uncharacterized protein n=1 Tax=Porites lobata TaxID=104759 RepID=A0ABN8QMZ6_9CNID|nr:unnamed protein product [Porites lobata]
MFWTEEHDVILVREMLANSPFAGTKRGTVQRGRKWNEISERLLQAEAPKFKVDQRGVRERYGLLAKAYRRKIRGEERASGISTPELTEVEQALEDLIVREDEADRDQQETAAQKRKVKEDKKDAEEVRKRAMERLGDRMKRSEIEGKGKKRRSSGNNTLEYLKERNEMLDEFKKELELKKQELQQEAKKNEAMMKLMSQQLAQQQKQTDGFRP